MKKIFNIPNLIMLVQILYSAATTVIVALYTQCDALYIILLQASALIGIVGVRLARPISELLIRFFKAFYPENTVDSPKEKSEAMLFFVKLIAYIMIGVQVVFLFVL